MNSKKSYYERGISLVLSVYNEEYYIKQSLTACIKSLESFEMPFEIIVVDDGSSDKSYDLLAEFSEKDERIKVIKNDINLNQGISLLRGLKHAKYSYVTINAIDLIFNLDDLKPNLTYLENHSAIVFERADRKNIPTFRNIISFFYLLLMKASFMCRINDFNFGQAFRNDDLQTVLPSVISRSPALVMTETILRLLKTGHAIHVTQSYPQAREMGEPSMGNFHVIFWCLYDLLRLRKRTFFGDW